MSDSNSSRAKSWLAELSSVFSSSQQSSSYNSSASSEYGMTTNLLGKGSNFVKNSFSVQQIPIKRLDSVGEDDSTVTSNFSYPPPSFLTKFTMGESKLSQDSGMFGPSNSLKSKLSDPGPVGHIRSGLVQPFMRAIQSFSKSEVVCRSAELFASLPNLKVLDQVDNIKERVHHSLSAPVQICRYSSRSHFMLAPSVSDHLHNGEINIMTSECFAEIQNHKHRRTKSDTSMCNIGRQEMPACKAEQFVVSDDTKIQNSVSPMISTNNLSVSDFASKRDLVEPLKLCKNPYISNLFRYENDSSDCESHESFIKPENSVDNNEISDSSYCSWSANSDDSDVSEGVSDFDSSDDCSESEDSDDSGDDCPWDKVLDNLNPWTACNKSMRKHSKHFTKSSHEACENEAVREGSAAATDHHEPHWSCDDVTSNGVNRPKCSNQFIASIIDWSSDPESDDCGESDDDSDSFQAQYSSNDLCADIFDCFMACSHPADNSDAVRPLQKAVNAKNADDHLTSNKQVQPNNLFPTSQRVQFSDMVVVYPMVTWAFAYKQSRKGEWETFARDRCRFHLRIERVERDISWVFGADHRRKILQSLQAFSSP